MIFHHNNKHTNKMSKIALTIKGQDPLKTGISSHCQKNPQQVRILRRFIRLSLMELLTIWPSLLNIVRYGNTNTTETLTMRYYVIKFVLEAYTLQDNTTCDIKIISFGQLVVKAQYLRYTKEKINWYWKQKQQQQVIIVTTRTSVHPCLDVVGIRYVHNIHRSVCNRNQSKHTLQIHPLCMTNPDHDQILEEIDCRDKIQYGINIRGDGDEE